MTTSTRKSVVIIGAGLSGCLLAVYLARAGHTIHVYERRPDPRSAGYQGGRSINLALSARGLWGLAGVGLDQTVLAADAVPMPGRALHDAAGRTTFQPYSKDPADAINSVSRAGLNLTLLNAATAYPNVRFIFDHLCEDVDLDAPAALFRDIRGRVVRALADVILGADGAFSPVRGRLQKTDRFELSQSYLAHGYKELHIPPVNSGPHAPHAPHAPYALPPNALHIWPRGAAMMIALPNRDGSFTCTLFWPFDGPHSFNALPCCAAVRPFFQQHYPDAAALMPTLEADYAANPVGSLVTIRCAPWHHAGKVAILGDAAHAIVPFYGQGMNAAFEDVRTLADLLHSNDQDFARALPLLEATRKPNADAIADMAVANFVEMRDLSGRPEFQHAKRIERVLHEAFGEPMTPQYNLVSFSTVPYLEAHRRGREMQQRVARVVQRLPHTSALTMSDREFQDRVLAAANAEPSKAIRQALIDISPPLSPDLAVWPGDNPLSREVLMDLAKGHVVTLSTLRSTVHLGAHADGPNHYGLGAQSVGERPLHHYIGPCTVIETAVRPGERMTVRDVQGGLDRVHPRVLIKTGTFSFTPWNSDFAALSIELIDALAARGVTTIGIDTPSVDLQDSKDLPAHKAILRHDISILEGLILKDVLPGEYELCAQPLKLMGFDGSPVRAVLRPIASAPEQSP